MSTFPESADVLITNAHILTMDDAFSEIEGGALAIVGNHIAAVGTVAAASQTRARQTIDALGGLVLPGFVNTHCHAAMTLFRGLADDRPLDGFLKAVWAAEAQHIAQSTVRAGATLGFAEMALGGITHVVDMYWYPEATVKAAMHVGIGLTSGPVFVGFNGYDGLGWSDRLKAAEDFVDEYSGMPGLHLMAMPHSVYTLDTEKLKAVASFARSKDLRVHIHAAEAPFEMAMAKDLYATTPIRVLENTGILAAGALVAHAVHLDELEIGLLAANAAAVVHNPVSNAKLASGTARLGDLSAVGVTVSLGTDGAASGNDLDLWRAMRQVAFLQIGSSGKPDIMPAKRIVAMATRGGAEAIGRAATKGRLAPGMDADLMVVDVRKPHMIPLYDAYSALVYSAGREDVAHVFVAGRHIVDGGRLTAVIEEELDTVRSIATAIKTQRAEA